MLLQIWAHLNINASALALLVKPACFADSSGMFWSVNDNNMLQEAQPDSVHVPSEKSMLLAALLMLCVCASKTCHTIDKTCTKIFGKHITESDKQ
jgi:hypothetical protein